MAPTIYAQQPPALPPAAPGPAPASPQLARLAPALAHIDAHLDEDLGLTMLARLCGLSADRFVEAFIAGVGVPPHRYLAHKRLDHARKLMAAGMLRLREPAPVC